jgi:hypothetical protein
MDSLQCHRSDKNWMCQVKVRVTFPNFADFWPFQESELVHNATCPIFLPNSKISTRNNTECPISNEIGLIEFESSLKKKLLFYPEHLFETSYRASQKTLYSTEYIS